MPILRSAIYNFDKFNSVLWYFNNFTALKKDKTIGNFEVGKDFDALVIDMEGRDQPDITSPTFSLPEHNLRERLEKLIYSGDDRNITEVYVQGRLVHSRLDCK